MIGNHTRLLWVLIALLAVTFVVSLWFGQAPIGVDEVARAVFGQGDARVTAVVFELRLPRALLGVIVGASLGLAGAAMQGLLRNPLAEPGVVGVSGCAGLGAVAVFYSGLAGVLPLGLPLGGMSGALLAVVLLYILSGRAANTLTLILAGVALNAFAGALTSLALNLSANPFAAFEIVFWLMGSVADRSIEHVYVCLIPTALGWALLLGSGKGLDALSLGEETAASMGVDLARLRATVIAGTALAVGAAVSVSGMIGFVGLVVPHLLRPLVGYQPGRLLLSSALGGAILMLLADIAVRAIPTEVELKIGVVTALIGAPFFFALIQRMSKGYR